MGDALERRRAKLRQPAVGPVEPLDVIERQQHRLERCHLAQYRQDGIGQRPWVDGSPPQALSGGAQPPAPYVAYLFPTTPSSRAGEERRVSRGAVNVLWLLIWLRAVDRQRRVPSKNVEVAVGVEDRDRSADRSGGDQAIDELSHRFPLPTARTVQRRCLFVIGWLGQYEGRSSE